MALIVKSDGSWQVLNQNGSWGLPDYGITEGIANYLRPGSQDITQSVAQNMQGTPYASSGNVPTTTNNSSVPNKSTGGIVLGQNTTSTPTTNNNNNNNGTDWSKGLTGEQVRALGMNPDSMVATNGKYYNQNGGDGGQGGSGFDESGWNTQMQALTDLGNYLQTSSTEGRKNIQNQYDTTNKQITDEQGTLQSGLDEQQRQLGESGRSAASEALRSYNALMQQQSSRYGMGSGAGQFLSDLIGQEYLRSKSGVDQQMQSGQNELAIEGQKTQQYISKKMGDLDSWRNDAFKSIDDNLQSKLYEIGSQKGVLEQQKAQQKQQAFFDALNYKQQVQQNEKQFKMDLASFAVQNLQQVTGQSYTPQEIAKVVSDMMSQSIQGITGQDNSVAYNPYAVMGKKTDEYGNPQ